MRKHPHRTSYRRCFTLIEVIVVLAVIGLLIALLLPAVQAARESARRIECTNNLKQIGIAVSLYENSFKSLPRGENGHSLHFTILPQLGYEAVYNSMNVSIPFWDAFFTLNSTIQNTRIAVFACPSDHAGAHQGGTNYLGNWGMGFGESGENGPFSVNLTSPPAEMRSVTDGASHTAALSEACRGIHRSLDPKRTVVKTPKRLTEPSQFELFVDLCSSVPITLDNSNGGGKGSEWLLQDLGHTLYNHNMTPNQRTCTNSTGVREGAWTANSQHYGGVNVLYLDGHVGFCRDGVATAAWRAIGTMNGAEILDTKSF